MTNVLKKCSQKRDGFRVKMMFLDTTFETLRQTGARRRRTSKIIVFFSKSKQTVTKKLTHLSSPCSLRNICGGFGGSGMAHAVSTRQPMGGEHTLTHLAFTCYALVRTTHHPSRSPSHQPSLATEHTTASRYQVVRKPNFLCMHALPPFLFSLSMFLFVF